MLVMYCRDTIFKVCISGICVSFSTFTICRSSSQSYDISVHTKQPPYLLYIVKSLAAANEKLLKFLQKMEPKTICEQTFEVYVYVSGSTKNEADDPLDSVLYFYPDHLSEEHILLTTGQLVGMAQFFKSILGEDPKYFQLEKGRFEIWRKGGFLIIIGGCFSANDSLNVS